MNYLTISKCDQLNYDGLRVVLWVSGCSHNCKGCQNPYSQDPSSGVKFDDNAKNEIFEELAKDWCAGITFSGGDPLFEANRKEVIDFAKEVKERFPEKSICVYTGYRWDEIVDDETMRDILKYADVIIDGEYVESLRSVDLPWVGSSNQHIIKVSDRLSKISSIKASMEA